MKIRVKRLVEGAPLPSKVHCDDFCYDVVAVSEEEVAPGVWRYGLGLAMQLDMGSVEWFGLGTLYSIDFRPRSSVWKTGMVLSNCEGTIDTPGYTGEISAVFYHVMPSMPRYRVGDRIGQIKIGTTVPVEFVEVDALEPTERGSGGYGSTGR